MNREETIQWFAELFKDNRGRIGLLQLAIIAECCLREISARYKEPDTQALARKIVSYLMELQREIEYDQAN